MELEILPGFFLASSSHSFTSRNPSAALFHFKTSSLQTRRRSSVPSQSVIN
jgi:hypothetical protein